MPFSLLALFGCASIIGLDDYTVAGSANKAGSGNASAGAAATAAAQSGDAGHGADAGQGGANGDGLGQAGGSAEAGEAGQPSQLPPIVGCDGVTTFKPNEQVVTSCIIRGGCSPYSTPVRSISTCVTFDTQLALPGEKCTRTATTCAEYQNCEHVGLAGAGVCGGALKTRCQDGLAINCGNYDTDRFTDCAALGGSCATYDDAGTTYADCQLDVSPDTSCAGETDDSKYFCHSAPGKEDLLYYCFQGEAYGSSCSSVGHCGLDESGASSCFYNLPTCTSSSVTCQNNVANVCSSESLFQYDCGGVGLSCGVNAGIEYCLAPGCKAADVDTHCTESCSDDGTQLTFCYGGAPYTVDCAKYGFTHCESDVNSDKVPFAACRP